jgi:TRAP-type C4-dicarboxylate transport system permease small subunit
MVNVAGWAYVFAALLICAEIVGRAFLSLNIPAVTELTGYILAFAITWGLADALAAKSHIRIEAVIEHLPPVPRAYLHTFALALLTLIALFFTWASWQVIEDSMLFAGRDTSALSIPLIVPQSAWAIGLAAFSAFALMTLVELVVLVVKGRHGAVNDILGARSVEELTDEVISVEKGL